MSVRDLATRLPSPVVRAVRRGLPAGVRARLGAAPPWRVGVATGPTLEQALATPGAPALDDEACRELGIELLADPFAVHVEGRWQLFVEVVGAGSPHGRIATLASDDLVSWTFGGIVLDEPFHLSFPSVLEEDGERFLVPESSADGTVRLYRCASWPDRFTLEGVLLSGAPYKDAAIVRHDDRWWMFVETSRHHTNDELRLFHAERLRGPWHPHPVDPIVRGDARWARPAGRPFHVDGQLWRTAQDSGRGYGRGVQGAVVTSLTPDRYEERRLPVPLLRPDPTSWRAQGTHHLDVHATPTGYVVFTDGHV